MLRNLPTFKSLPQAIGLPFLSSREDAQLAFKAGENGLKRLSGDDVSMLECLVELCAGRCGAGARWRAGGKRSCLVKMRSQLPSTTVRDPFCGSERLLDSQLVVPRCTRWR